MPKRITESPSLYNDLDLMTTTELLQNINREDSKVPKAVKKAIPQIEKLVEMATECIIDGGRLFYIGAGTSGRLGVLDASECPPTYGVSPDLVIGLIAGGDHALRNAVENAEDNETQAWHDLNQFQISDKDFVIGIAASGTTPYVIGGLRDCQQRSIMTGCIVCNKNTHLAEVANFPIEVIVGPEFVTGSTRMKSGTAQKLVLNMISTSIMIKIGRVKGNKMVDMALTNVKLRERGARMIMQELNIDFEAAQKLLQQHGSVRKAIHNS